MSYSRRFRRRIEVPYHGSKTVTYPPSENGGSKTVYYEGTAYEDVEVDIHVNTTSFDASVVSCNNHVNGLTASVATMNTAQCVSIAENADKVSKTIIKGFFDTVRTDLSTQKMELQQAVEAKLILLRQQAASLKEKQKTMADDYARTTARYQKLFSDLNNELSVRIHQVDQPVFDIVSEADSQSDRMLHTDMIQTAVTMGKESGMLQAQISAAAVKHHALESMQQIQGFLVAKARTERTIVESCIDGTGNDSYLVPVCYMKTVSENKCHDQQCVVPDYYASHNSGMQQQLCDCLEGMDWDDTDNSDQLNSYVQTEIAKHLPGDDKHSQRVRDIINKMLNK